MLIYPFLLQILQHMIMHHGLETFNLVRKARSLRVFKLAFFHLADSPRALTQTQCLQGFR